MEGNGEISDTDSGIILHSGSDSPTTTTKDVTTHTRAMKLKHQALQDSLQLCVLELKKLCIREAELTGELSADYPLAPGETPPKVRRRIGAAFQLDEQSIPRGPEESQLNLVDAELALQLKIYEAARRLVREEHQNKAVRRSRVQQCRREERKVKELQESAFQLRLQHGRSSPLPAFSIPLQERGNSDDSSLSDSPILDEEVHHPPPSSGPPCRDPNHLPQTFPGSSPSTPNSSILSSPVTSQPHTPISRTPSQLTPSQLTPIKRTLSHHAPIKRTPSQLTPSRLTPILLTPSQLTLGQLTPSRQGSPGLDSVLSFTSNPETEAPPIQPSPWMESSLDQPFQKTKKSRSSTKSTTSCTTPSQVLPPLEVCLANAGLPQQMSKLKLSTSLSNGSPSSPEPRLHRNLSLRISNPETPLEERTRGRTRSARRRLTDYTVTIPEASRGNPAAHHGTPEAPGGNPAGHYGTPEAPGGNPAGHYGTPEAPGGNPAGHYGTPEAARRNPAGHYGTPEAARGIPAGQYGTPEAPGGNPAGHYGTPEAARRNPAGHYGTPEAARGIPAGHYGTPEAPGGNPAGHYGTPEAPSGIPAGHYGTPEAARRNPAGHYGTPEAARGIPAGHYGTPEVARGIPAGHYGTPEVAWGSPLGHYGNQEDSEDSHSEHSWTTCTGSVFQEQHSEFHRARQFQHPSPTGGPGPHAFQSPGVHQIPRYQASPGFNRGHCAGDAAYALDLDLTRGYHDHRARSIRRDYLYAEAPGPAAAAPRRAPQQAGLSRSPSLWEHPGLPQQLVDDQLKSWHQRSQFRGARPRSLDRQGAVRVKTAPDWVSPLAHHQRYQEQVMKQRVLQRTAEDGPGHWFGDDSSKIVSQV